MSSSAAIRAGRAFVELFTKDDELRRGLKAARTRIDNFAKGVNALSNHLLALGSAAAVPFGFAIKAASDLEETMSKFNVVFGKSSAAVQKWGDDFAASVGRSKRQVAEFLAGTQDLLVPVGIDPRRAEELSKTITQLAVDLGSFNNMADATVLRDLQAALTGSGETMKKYGVIVSEAAVKQELLNQKIDPTRATDAEKVMARLNIILRGTTAAQGDALRTADSFANRTKSLAAEIENAAGEIGGALLPVLTPLIDEVVKAVKEFAAWAAENKALVVDAAKLTAGMLALGVALKPVALALTTLSGLGKGLDLAIIATRALGPWGLLAAAIGSAVFYFDQLLTAAREWERWEELIKSNKPFEQAKADAKEIAAALERVSASLDNLYETPEQRAERGGLPRANAAVLREAGRSQADINREMERTWDRPGGFSDEDLAKQREDQRKHDEEARERQRQREQQFLDDAQRIMEAFMHFQEAEEAAARQQAQETARLLDRMPETLIAGSEAAAKAMLEVRRENDPAVQAAKIAERQAKAAEEANRRLDDIARELRGPMRVEVDGYALGR